VTSLPDSLLEDWFLHGKLSSTSVKDLPPQPKLDVIFTWVNGSDTLWQLGQLEQAERNGIPQPRLKGVNRHWRENGMGRFGLRSVVEAFSQKEDEEDETIIGVKGNNGIRRIHVLTADLSMDGLGLTWENETSGEVGRGVIQTQEGRARWSLGQVPDWLDTSALVPLLDERVSSSGSGVELQWHFHSEAFHIAQSLFDMPNDNERKSVSWANEKAWKDQALPTFNSFAIETQIGWLKGMSDVRLVTMHPGRFRQVLIILLHIQYSNER
jgi:3-O-alpha-D-mannopyranosyl-alpha-D-mannopyranose xylosylphosphotransferase